MAKAKKKNSVTIERNAAPPSSIRTSLPFDDLRVGDAFYVDADRHAAARTATSRKNQAGAAKYRVRKVKDPKHKEHGRIGVYRIS